MLNGSQSKVPLVPPHSQTGDNRGNQPAQHASTQNPPHEGFWERTTTDPVAAFTLVLAVATLGLWYFTWRMWRTTRNAVLDAARQHAVSNRAFVYLRNLATVAFCDLKEGRSELSDWRITLEWKNSGNTPAKNGMVSLDWNITEGALPADFQYSYSNPVQIIFVGPQAKISCGTIDVPNAELTKVAQGTQRIFIWGCIQYRDIFPKSRAHHTKFCVEVQVRDDSGGRTMAFVPFGPHNESDEDERAVKWPQDMLSSVVASVADVHRG